VEFLQRAVPFNSGPLDDFEIADAADQLLADLEWYRRSDTSLSSAGALRHVMLIESLPHECFDNGLTAHVQVASSAVEFL
jgi:hypothetical protein